MTSTIDLAPIICLSLPERIGIVQSILDSIAVEAEKPELSDSIKELSEINFPDSLFWHVGSW